MSQTQEQATKAHHRLMQQRQQAEVRGQEWANKQRDSELVHKDDRATHTQVHQTNQALEQGAKQNRPGTAGAQPSRAHAQAAEQSGKHGHALTEEYRAKQRDQEALDKGQARAQFQRHLSDEHAREQSAKAGNGQWINRAEEQREKASQARAGQAAYRAAVDQRHRQNLGEVRAKRAFNGPGSGNKPS